MFISVQPSGFPSATGPFWARITIEHDGYVFPEPNWEDLAISVMDHWLPAIASIAKSEDTTELFDFADGPVFFSCRRVGDALTVKCFHDGAPPKIVMAFVASAKEFISSYVVAYDKLCEIYAELKVDAYEAKRIERWHAAKVLLHT